MPLIGKDQSGSGFDPGLAIPPITFGVWGDSGTGMGVVGTSSDPGQAAGELGGPGVYGLNNAAGGLGVRGQADHQTGVAVLGSSTQGTGVAGRSQGTGIGVVGTSSEGAGVSGSSSAGVGVTAESTGAAALHARRPTTGGAVIEARLATAERAAEFTGDVQTSGSVTVGANLTSKGFTISSATGRLAVSDATVGAERLTIDPTGMVNLPTGLRTSSLRVSGDAVVGAGGDGSLTLRHIKGKSAKDDTADELYLNWDTGQAVHIGRSANRADLQIHGNAVVGAGGDGSLTLRHIKGKSAKADTADDLYLNWDTGQAVHVGGGKRADLRVSGDAVVGAGGDGSLTLRHIKGKSAKADTADDLYLNADTGRAVHVGGGVVAPLLVHGPLVVEGDVSYRGELTIDKSASVHGTLTATALRSNQGLSVPHGATLTSDGRLHISGEESLYLLNKSGVIVSKAWQGTGNLTVEGNFSCRGQFAVEAISSSGTLTVTSDLAVTGNARVSNAFVGDVGHGPTWAGFAHASAISPLSYGLLQSDDGRWTLINKRSGSGAIELRIDNNTVLRVDDAGSLRLRAGAAVNEFSTDSSLGDNTDAAVPTERAVRTYVDHHLKVQGGEVPGRALRQGQARTSRVQMTFPQAFGGTPTVILAIHVLDVDHNWNFRCNVLPEAITATGFVAVYQSWADTDIYLIGARYVAFGPG
jgi:cytoskeletal protein CcmA (bactofilin family)